MKHMLVVRKSKGGFALPTILIASVIMLTLLASAVSAVGSLSASIDTQYYNRLAREAAESGVARATDCLRQSANYAPGWSDNAPLMPNTDCNGVVISGKSKYISEVGNVKTSFQVRLPGTSTASSVRLASSGNVYLVRASDSNSVWRAYSQSLAQDSRYQEKPQVGGGAGWQNSGHIGFMVSTTGQLFGYGDNTSGQVNDLSSPTVMSTPFQMTLPAGVASVKKAVSSGQGASYICIIGNNDRAYCRGQGAALGAAWSEVRTTSSTLQVSSIVLNGYSGDGGCVISSTPTGVPQAYCFGVNDFGMLGIGQAAYTQTTVGDARRFLTPSGVPVTKVMTHDAQTCAILETGDMYCAGMNNGGQLAAPLPNPANAPADNFFHQTPVRYPIPGARKVADVTMQYHGNSGALHVLATDGTIWGSGWYSNGELGNGTTSGSTGSSETPVLFTTTQPEYATGSILWNSNSSKCLDNNGNSSSNGNKIQIWACSSPPTANVAQMWVYGENKQLTNLGTGKCLDVPANTSVIGTAVQLWDCNNTPAQQFTLVGGDSGATVQHISSGLCLDIPGAATASGTAVTVYTCNGSIAQSFTRYSGINGWRGMITGANHFCGIRSDSWSGMWCAGNNTYGQLLNWATAGGSFMGQCQNAPNGGYNYFNVNLPNGEKVDVNRLTDEWSQQFNSTMVITTVGNVYGSGRNQYGKLGSDTLGDSANSYRQCVAQQFNLPAGVTAVNMSTRDEYTTYVLGSDNKIYASGRNNNGQLGDTTTTDRLSPVEVKIPRQAANY